MSHGSFEDIFANQIINWTKILFKCVQLFQKESDFFALFSFLYIFFLAIILNKLKNN